MIKRERLCFASTAQDCATIASICCHYVLVAHEHGNGRTAHIVGHEVLALLGLLKLLQLHESLLHRILRSGTRKLALLLLSLRCAQLFLQVLDCSTGHLPHKARERLRIAWLSDQIINLVERSLHDVFVLRRINERSALPLLRFVFSKLASADLGHDPGEDFGEVLLCKCGNSFPTVSIEHAVQADSSKLFAEVCNCHVLILHVWPPALHGDGHPFHAFGRPRLDLLLGDGFVEQTPHRVLRGTLTLTKYGCA
mmetsp:Transcript_26412/g.58148  ORF Transcript_26412/g.58148 Transcript_26412/m.58148 type:complete len:253 (+) Transcript_26412:380-1138(+)